jgi:hypothetical protein
MVNFSQMDAVFPGGPADTFEILITGTYGALKRKFFSIKDSHCPTQIAATAVYASFNSARPILIYALRSPLSERSID